MLYSAMSYHALRVARSDMFVMSNNRVFNDTTSKFRPLLNKIEPWVQGPMAQHDIRGFPHFS